LESLGNFPKILTQTSQVPKLLDGAKIGLLEKSLTLCTGRTARTLQTDNSRRQTDGSYYKSNVT